MIYLMDFNAKKHDDLNSPRAKLIEEALDRIPCWMELTELVMGMRYEETLKERTSAAESYVINYAEFLNEDITVDGDKIYLHRLRFNLTPRTSSKCIHGRFTLFIDLKEPEF